MPTRPNGSTGWVYVSGDAADKASNDNVVNVDLVAFQLEIIRSGQSVGRWTVGIGKPEFPTPKSHAFILASIKETVNTYSPIVLPLSVHSDAHTTFGGGPGTVGIHTWPSDGVLGKAGSDGCIRVPQQAMDRLVELPLGTIVNIT
jgi:lipoprotein-anchoring transpeptidase ErfK/SrfK